MITSTHNLLLSSIKCCSFFVVKNKQTRLRFLVLEKFITCLPPLARAKMAGIVNKVYCDISRPYWYNEEAKFAISSL